MTIMFTLKEFVFLVVLQIITAFTAVLIVEFINYNPDRSIGLIGYNKNRVNPTFLKKLQFFVEFLLGKDY